MLKYIFGSRNCWYKAFPFLLFFWAAGATAVTITDEGSSVLIENESTVDSVTISSVSQDDENLTCICVKNCSGSFFLESAATKGKPANRIASLRCAYTPPLTDESTTISVLANGVAETKTISGGDSGGDPGPNPDPETWTAACVGDDIGFVGTGYEWNGTEVGTGEQGAVGEYRLTGAADYIVFNLAAPSFGDWGNRRYLESATIRAYRDGSVTNAEPRNIVFGGEPSNTFNEGGQVIDYPSFKMPINSKAFLNVQSGTNTSGVNVELQPGWGFVLCGQAAGSASDYAEYASMEDAEYKGYFIDKETDSRRSLDLGGGVNVMGGEYACAQGWGFHHHTAVGVSHKQLKKMLLDWGVKTVRLPMNEHCWVSGLNGDGTAALDDGPRYSDSAIDSYWFQYIRDNNQKTGRRANFANELIASAENCRNRSSDSNNPLYSVNCIEQGQDDLAQGDRYSVCSPSDNSKCSTQGHGYRNSFRHLVDILTGAGIKVVLDLHWSAESDSEALGLTDLPSSLSRVFWRSVSDSFKDKSDSVLYNLFNEPRKIPGDATYWKRWRDGGDGFVGMQELVNIVRIAGASNPIVIGGLDYGGDLRGWLTHVPYDPLGKIWADSHSYPTGDYKCWADSGSEDEGYACWDRTLLPIVNEGFGAMFGEAGNSISRGGCGADKLKYLYSWVNDIDDRNALYQNSNPGGGKGRGIPVLQWAFLPGGAVDDSNTPSTNSCRIPSVITRWPGKKERLNGNEWAINNSNFLAGTGDKGEYGKNTEDPTPTIATDDGTWAGCLNWAYLNKRTFSVGGEWRNVDDTDAQGLIGNCSMDFPVSITANE